MENLKDTIFKFLKLDNLVDNISGYIEARVELIKIEIREDVARFLARAILMMITLFLALLVLLFCSIGLAHFLNALLDHPTAGYWIVAGIYGVPCLILIFFRKSIGHSLEQRLVKAIKNKEK